MRAFDDRHEQRDQKFQPKDRNVRGEIKLTQEELEAIKDDVRFRERVIYSLRRLDQLPCDQRDREHKNEMKEVGEAIGGIKDTLSAIKTQVYFQWAVLFVLLCVIIKGQ